MWRRCECGCSFGWLNPKDASAYSAQIDDILSPLGVWGGGQRIWECCLKTMLRCSVTHFLKFIYCRIQECSIMGSTTFGAPKFSPAPSHQCLSLAAVSVLSFCDIWMLQFKQKMLSIRTERCLVTGNVTPSQKNHNVIQFSRNISV